VANADGGGDSIVFMGALQTGPNGLLLLPISDLGKAAGFFENFFAKTLTA